MNATQNIDGSIFLWITVLILLTIIALFIIRSVATVRSARSSFEDKNSKELLARLERDVADTKTRLAAVEKVLNDV